jgi:sulfur-oxidizing protein SoxA
MTTLRILAVYCGVWITGVSLASVVSALEPKSGFEFLTPETQEMQRDEFSNPGMKTVEDGRKWFYDKGVNGKTCADCHGRDGSKFNTKRLASYPMYSEKLQRPITLQERINMCWEDELNNVPFVYDCVDLIELETFVRYLARGEQVNVVITEKLRPFYEQGEKLYHTRFGQLNMSCATCHDIYAGQNLRGQLLSQGQSNGYPAYRLGSGKTTGLHGRFNECLRAFRAEPFDAGAPEYINLELYLHTRGNGLAIEIPALRY